MFGRIRKVEKAFRRLPRVPLFARLADEHLRRGRVQRALALCEEGCERFPRYATGFFVLGRCYEERGMWPQARSALDRGLQLDPDNPAGLQRLSRVHRRLGQGERALECLERAAALDPLSRRLAKELSSLAAEVRPPAAAEGAVPEAPAPAAAPAAPGPRPAVSRLGAPEDAELTALLREIDRTGRVPGEPAAAEGGPVPTVTLARLYARQGFPERALETYQRVLAADPGNQAARLGAETMTAT